MSNNNLLENHENELDKVKTKMLCFLVSLNTNIEILNSVIEQYEILNKKQTTVIRFVFTDPRDLNIESNSYFYCQYYFHNDISYFGMGPNTKGIPKDEIPIQVSCMYQTFSPNQKEENTVQTIGFFASKDLGISSIAATFLYFKYLNVKYPIKEMTGTFGASDKDLETQRNILKKRFPLNLQYKRNDNLHKVMNEPVVVQQQQQKEKFNRDFGSKFRMNTF